MEKIIFFFKRVKRKSLSWLMYLFGPRDQAVRYGTNSIFKGHTMVTYRGVRYIKDPFDYILYQMILMEVRPDLVIEVGTNRGGGALYLADLMDKIGHGTVHTIDIVNDHDPLVETNPRVKFFYEGWEKYDVNSAKGFNKVLVIDDGSHMYESTVGSLNKFGPLVSAGSYLIVEDGIVTPKKQAYAFHGGPLKAIREFLKGHPNFIIDRKWCDFFGKNATFNINGYLKRVS